MSRADGQAQSADTVSRHSQQAQSIMRAVMAAYKLNLPQVKYASSRQTAAHGSVDTPEAPTYPAPYLHSQTLQLPAVVASLQVAHRKVHLRLSYGSLHWSWVLRNGPLLWRYC